MPGWGLSSELQTRMSYCPVRMVAVMPTRPCNLMFQTELLSFSGNTSVLPLSFSHPNTEPCADFVSFTFNIHPESHHLHCFYSGLSYHLLPTTLNQRHSQRKSVKIHSDHVTALSKTWEQWPPAHSLGLKWQAILLSALQHPHCSSHTVSRLFLQTIPQTYQASPCLRAFAPPVLHPRYGFSSWYPRGLPPYLSSLFKCYHLIKAFPDHPVKIATLSGTPYSPSLLYFSPQHFPICFI